MTIREELTQCLPDVASDPKLLAECQKLCEMYGITPQNLQFKWEAATFSSITPARAREAARFTMESLAGVKAQIKRELEKGSGTQKKAPARSLASGVASVNRSKMPFAMNRNLGTNGKAAQRFDAPVKVEAESFGSLDFDSTAASVAGPSKVTYKGPQIDAVSKKQRAYRYMFEKTGERGQVLDMRIQEMAELVQQHYGIQDLSDPVSSTDEEVVVVGRITHEFDSPKLTEATLTLETSRRLSDHSGARIAVRFDPALKIRGGAQGAGGLGLFPGSIVALKGQNGGAGWFSATEILALPSPANSPTIKASPDDDSFSMCIASGPFTPDSDLEYKPWNSFLKTIKQRKPPVVVLIGPFVDSSHPLIQSGDVDESPLDLFQRVFLEPLRQFLDLATGSIAILIPSVRDLVSTHSVYPQSELSSLVTKGDPRIRLVPNPSTFSLNGITFGATSVDVLIHLRKEEVIKRGQEVDSVASLYSEDNGTDLIGNTCRHILQQRSFYPVFPVPLELSNEVNLDVTHSDGLKLDAETEDVAPDVLILPSKLKQFCKTVHATTAVNPSTLIKGIYASIQVSSSAPGKTVRERIKTEVLKMED